MQERQRTLSFSIEGELITNLAREKLYANNDIKAAVELLMSCLVTDQITPEERFIIALKILDGKMKIVGTYPSDDYDVVETTPNEQDDITGVVQYLEARESLFQQMSEDYQKLLDKFIFISENISDSTARRLNEEWTDFADIPGKKLFDKLSGESTVANVLVDDYLTQARIENEFEDNYGWLAPDGTFYPVKWGDHQSWAYKRAKKDYPDEAPKFPDCASGDILIRHNWILLHSPSMGVAKPQRDYTKRITKKQSDFLYGYYSDRNLPKLAEEYLQDQ